MMGHLNSFSASGGGNLSRGAFCVRMLRRKYFDVSNRWYAPALRLCKSQNGEQIFRRCKCLFLFPVVTCVKRVKKISQMVLWSPVESPNQVRFRRSRPKQTLLVLIIWLYQRS